MRKVPNKFPLINVSPRIAIVGEAPGAEEEKLGSPFVGYSGKVLTDALQRVQIIRNACFVGNVYQYRPPNNDISKVDQSSLEWKECIDQLTNDLTLFQPDVIVALGDKALEVLTGRRGISKWRGSILPCTLVSSKVVPTYHPAYILRQFKWFPILKFDIERAKEEATVKGLSLPEREYIVSPSFNEVMQFIEEAHKVQRIAVDFETLRDGGEPLCLGIATSPTKAIAIPLGSIFSMREEAEVWKAISSLMRSPVEKVMQNALFDMLVFAVHAGIEVRNLKMDTMLAWHACYPELPKSLAFISSILTREPYYKFEHKDSEVEANDKGWAATTSWEKLARYCCKDCCVTWECSVELEQLLTETHAHRGYNLDMSMIPVALSMTLQGIKVDAAVNLASYKKTEEEIEAVGALIAKTFGRTINVKSPKDMKNLLYDELGLPPVLKDGRPTTDADALITLSRRHRRGDLQLLLKQRQLRTKLSFFALRPDGSPEYTWRDGRLHSSYNIAGTETGRWSSSASILGGRNIMNIPEDCRHIFVPDDGKIFVGWDKAQAEARVVAYKSFVTSGDPSYKKLIDSGVRPHVWFGERLIERKICPISLDEFHERKTPDAQMWYYISKVSIHGFTYGLGHKSWCAMVAKETDGDVVVELGVARQIRETLYEVIPAIPAWQKSIQIHLYKSRIMINSFGRTRTFQERWGDSLFKEAYAFEPQSTVADDVALAILAIYQANWLGVDILQQNYDSALYQVRRGEEMEVIKRMTPLVTQPIHLLDLRGGPTSTSFVIPVEFKVGDNWRDMEVV